MNEGDIYDIIINTDLPLNSRLILEIPDINKSFSELNRYIDLAKDRGVEIRFRLE